MPLGETARLAVDLSLTGNFNKGIASAQKSLGGMEKQTKSFVSQVKGSILTGVGLGAGVTGFTLLSNAISGTIDLIGDAVHAAAEEDAAIQQLTTSIKANDEAWDGNLDRIEDVIQARQDLAFADDEQRESLRQLVAVTHDVNEALQLQAVAMDLARLKNISLVDAGNLLGKVYGGNISILRRYGIQIDKNATSTEALAAIQKMASGQAAAYADTTQGALVRSQIALDNAMEDLGRTLTPVVTGLAQLAADVIPKVAAGVSEIVQEVGPLLDLLPGSDPRWGDWATKIREAGVEVGMTSDEIRMMESDLRVLDSTLANNVAPSLGRVATEAERNAILQKELDEAIRDYTPTLIKATGATGQMETEARRTGIAMLKLAADTTKADQAAQELADGVDLGKGAFKDFRSEVEAQQKRIKFFIRHPEMLRREQRFIESNLAGLERQKEALEKGGISRRERLQYAGVTRLIATLKGRTAEWEALGTTQGNAVERAMERAFKPDLKATVDVDWRWEPFRPPPGFSDPIIRNPNKGGTGGGTGPHASGGVLWPGQWGTMGERGPERIANVGGVTVIEPMNGRKAEAVAVTVRPVITAFMVGRELGRAATTRRSGAGVL